MGVGCRFLCFMDHFMAREPILLSDATIKDFFLLIYDDICLFCILIIIIVVAVTVVDLVKLMAISYISCLSIRYVLN